EGADGVRGQALLHDLHPVHHRRARSTDAAAPLAGRGEPMKEAFVRFSRLQGAQHVAVMILFIVLALTGFPQKFSDAAWARGALGLMGGVELARALHRFAGIAFTLLAAAHVGTSIVLI